MATTPELHIDSQIRRMQEKIAALDAAKNWQEAAKLRRDLDKLVLGELAKAAGRPVGVLKYSSNNSGGAWWLSSADWAAMAEAGWVVHYNRGHGYGSLVDALTPSEPTGETWLGATATSAALACSDPDEAVRAWESVTGQNAGDEGCNCCGPPHGFEWIDPSGESHYGGIAVTSTLTGF